VLWFIWFLLFAFDVMQISARHRKKGPAGVEGVTRLTVVPLRSSPIQGNDKNLGPLSTPRLGNLTRLSGNKRYRRQPEFPFWNPEWLTVYPEVPAWNFYVARVKTFSGRVCSKALTLEGTQIRDPDDLRNLGPPIARSFKQD
jgi:hypothetical protein